MSANILHKYFSNESLKKSQWGTVWNNNTHKNKAYSFPLYNKLQLRTIQKYTKSHKNTSFNSRTYTNFNELKY